MRPAQQLGRRTDADRCPYICNPTTRKQALLPQPKIERGLYNTIIGFFGHHPTREYRVLWVSGSQHAMNYSLYILTVGFDEPRHVKIKLPTKALASVKQTLLHRPFRFSCECPSVYHHNNLHWNPRYGAEDMTGGGRDIIMFDTEAESFWWMRSPTPTQLGSHNSCFLD